MTDQIANRIAQLREHMKAHKIDFYFVPARDAHNNEYVPACWQRRSYISGFTGSAGDVIIGLEEAYLWTDPRYFLQAEQELNTQYFTLMKQKQGEAAPIHEWLAEHAANKTVGVDPTLLSLQEEKLWRHALSQTGGKILAIEHNLVDAIWTDRPALSGKPITVLDPQYSGLTAAEKIHALRQTLETQHCDAHVITMLDAIAWLYNIRGQDIDYNPLVISYALITKEAAYLFVDGNKLDDKAQQHCKDNGITVRDYTATADALKALHGTCLLEAHTASFWVANQLHDATVHTSPSPITLMKAIKNPTEIAGAREAHRRDGVALCKIFHWLENHWQGQTELSVSKKVSECRAEDPHNRGASFSTISGYAEHGAIIHYFVTPETDKAISDDNLLLLDSGGQYYEGTTDVTRTTHLGTPTDAQKRHYTLVLKGHLALRHLRFPEGICGEQVNAIAQTALWREGLSYGHGTGHGVGAYLCVHEGPQRISNAYTRVPLLPGMIVSNEPGVYITGQHGIRIENLCLISEKIPAKDSLTEDRPFFGLEDLTLFPYERKLIDKTLLTEQEIAWVDAYHQQVYSALQDDLDEVLKEWLKTKTAVL